MSKQDGSGRQVTDDTVDDSGASILHVDMDAFFASVELLSRPELRGTPVIVGGTGPRAVVAAANYEARRYGVNSAMPMSVALRRCPSATVLPVNGRLYGDYSRRVMAIFEGMTPLVEKLSIDEAFLDVSGARRLHGSSRQIAARIRERVHAETGLTCSVGVAATKFVAKVASSKAKPDGLLVIPAAETLQFLHPLPVSALWGVGPSTEQTLARLGLSRIGDIAATPFDVLQNALGEALASRLYDLSNGIDARSVSTRREEKSVGQETTFSYDVTDEAEIRRVLLRQADDVAARLRSGGLVGRTVSLKVRYTDFTTLTKSRTLAEPTNVGRRIYDEALAAWHASGAAGRRIRLIGVRMEQLGEAGSALSLWDPDEGWRDADAARDEIAARFGRDALRPATLLKRPTAD
ncbi:DNA polymerase IV [Rathayibacter sp. YIM 133350]|uniref:DNA polymerase IV n=1 Tax=Rathayibacter sp. YIM 133350 TaxID=3131992 RepID=UPI00307E4F43